MVTKVIEEYELEGKLIHIKSVNSGNINKTYVAYFEKEDGTIVKYLIQKINTAVFTNPYELMKNMEGVTAYLKEQMTLQEDDKHQVSEVIKTKDGDLLCCVDEENNSKGYYRICKFIENAIAHDQSTDIDIVYNVGKAFGNFAKLLSDYPASELTETIKDFHDTRKRYERFIADIKTNPKGRVEEVRKEIDYIKERESICSLIMDKLGTEAVPIRVTHNDTKVNNVMIHKNTNEFVAVIDLDTVMPGSMLFDYGDGIRSTASTAKEDETDLSKVGLDFELFKTYTDGYMSEMAPYITQEELALMSESIRIITLELAMRFLNDYINGDTYFKINYPTHNLDRARNQLAIVKDIENKMDDIKAYISESYKKHINESPEKPKVKVNKK